MRKMSVLSTLLMLFLIGLPGVAGAQGPLPPEVSLSAPIVQESSRVEVVPQMGPNGTDMKAAPVNLVEQSETAYVAPATTGGDVAPSVIVDGVTVTMWRAIGSYPWDEFNYKVRTGARTQTDQCVDDVWVLARHKYWGPSGTFWGYEQSASPWIGCENDTGEAWISWGDDTYIFARGTTHLAVAKHDATIWNKLYQWHGPDGEGETGPERTL